MLVGVGEAQGSEAKVQRAGDRRPSLEGSTNLSS